MWTVASVVVVILDTAGVVPMGVAGATPIGAVAVEFAFELAATAVEPPVVAATIPEAPATAATPMKAMVMRGCLILCSSLM
jgi:hypothetical protein